MFDPPSGVGGKAVAQLHIKALHGDHEPQVALLYDIVQRDIALPVFTGEADDEAQIGFSHPGVEFFQLAEKCTQFTELFLYLIHRHEKA